jgi:hypothetical protein
MINCKAHLDREGVNKLVGIKFSINKGLTSTLLEAFPDMCAVDRPKREVTSSIDPDWLAGFIDGEGCFNVHITNSTTHKTGTQVKLRFILTQHTRDLDLMQKLVQVLECGILTKYGRKPAVDLTVMKFGDINTKIIPFLNKYPLQSSKRHEFADFGKIAEYMKDKARARGPCKTQRASLT